MPRPSPRARQAGRRRRPAAHRRAAGVQTHGGGGRRRLPLRAAAAPPWPAARPAGSARRTPAPGAPDGRSRRTPAAPQHGATSPPQAAQVQRARLSFLRARPCGGFFAAARRPAARRAGRRAPAGGSRWLTHAPRRCEGATGRAARELERALRSCAPSPLPVRTHRFTFRLK
jgi:hypothetical protein